MGVPPVCERVFVGRGTSTTTPGGTPRRQVVRCRDRLAGLVERLDPAAVPLPEAPGLWGAFDRIERLAAAAKSLLAARVAESGEWKRAGFRSPAEHLAREAGTTVGEARAALEVSRAIDDLPAPGRR